jgi:hypothetical protein
MITELNKRPGPEWAGRAIEWNILSVLELRILNVRTGGNDHPVRLKDRVGILSTIYIIKPYSCSVGARMGGRKWLAEGVWQSLTLMSHLWTSPQSSSQHCHLSSVIAVSTASEQSTLRFRSPHAQNSITTNYPVQESVFWDLAPCIFG